MRKILVSTLTIAFGSCWTQGRLQAQEWVDLFDGKTLNGWTQKGGEAEYSVEDGQIVGIAVPNTPNSFLCTEKEFGDFILEAEFKVDASLNSGIQIRSQSLPDYKNGRVHGYQVEIDPSDRGWSGGIYDEGRRGWLSPLAGNDKARYAFKQNDWNHYRIEAIGDRIRTWINGVPAAVLVDSMTLKGFIGLQVHGVGKRDDRPQNRWRNIRIQDLGESSWKPLFNGKDATGWKPTAGGEWTVVDGILKGTSPASEKRHGILINEGEFKDFTARVEYRSLSGNSGFYFRVEEVDHAVAVRGFQAEIDAAGGDVGGIYETLGRAWVVKPSPEEIKKFYKPKDWNVMTVSAHGPRIVVSVNGTKTVDFVDSVHFPKALGLKQGKLGVQMHGSQKMDIEFRAIEILETAAARPVDDWDPAELKPAAVVPDGADVRKLAGGFKFTEGPAKGPDGRIYFNDIPNERTHVYDPESGETTVWRENTGRANGLWWTPGGRLLACEGGARRVSRQLGEEIVTVVDSFDGKKLNSPNDLALDSVGGFFFTDPRYGGDDDRELEKMSVYYVDRRDKITLATDDVEKPNGVIFSPDYQTLYVADTEAKKIWAFDAVSDGKLANKREFYDSGSDGMAVDVQGNVYLTSGAVLVISPEGELVAEIETPERPANVAFGGKENRTLYITARTGFYAIDLGVPGAL